MAKKGDLVFNLGQEELLFLLNLLQASTTLGIEPDIYKELNGARDCRCSRSNRSGFDCTRLHPTQRQRQLYNG